MIIKSLSSKSPRYHQILEYLNNNEGKVFNSQGQTFVLKQNLKGKSNKQLAKEFMLNEAKRVYVKSNNVKFYQDIIAFSDLDNSRLTIPIIEDLTRQYIKLRSPYAQCYGIAHFNNHYHVHLVISPIEYHTGMNIRMTKSQFAEIKQQMQIYQREKYPELDNSIVRHGQGQTNSIKNMKSRQTNLEDLKSKVNHCYIMGNGQQHFLDLLEKENFKPYERDGFIVGIKYNGKKYRFSKLLPGCNVKIDTREELVEKNRYEELQELRYLENERMEREIDEMDKLGLIDREL